ncbi:MAG: hypothetical protein ABR587_16040, partial [Candidatus Binatia bacterium]
MSYGKSVIAGTIAGTWGTLCILALSTPALADRCVEPTGAGGCDTTIQGAVDLATAGEKITVNPGYYREVVTVPSTLPGLHLAGKKGAVLDSGPPLSGAVLTILASEMVISGLTMQVGFIGIVIGDNGTTMVDDVTVTGVVVRSTSNDCIAVRTATNVR